MLVTLQQHCSAAVRFDLPLPSIFDQFCCMHKGRVNIHGFRRWRLSALQAHNLLGIKLEHWKSYIRVISSAPFSRLSWSKRKLRWKRFHHLFWSEIKHVRWRNFSGTDDESATKKKPAQVNDNCYWIGFLLNSHASRYIKSGPGPDLNRQYWSPGSGRKRNLSGMNQTTWSRMHPNALKRMLE